MKRILIAGVNSYIGVSFENHVRQWPEEYAVDTVDLIGDGWKQRSFFGYDAVFYVAGIAHRKETAENALLYYQVNRDLAAEFAKKAKADGVGQLVFMSSMSVYGMERGVITPETVPTPKTNYGKSKLEAENALNALRDDTFRVAVLRPPMVYGKDCRGNFQQLLHLVQSSPVFPVVRNRRSMISIENLCEFVRMIVDSGEDGLFFPQNREYINTTDMARHMARESGKRVFFSRLAGLGVQALIPFVGVARKAFSTLIYQGCEQHGYCYCVDDFDTSMEKSL